MAVNLRLAGRSASAAALLLCAGLPASAQQPDALPAVRLEAPGSRGGQPAALAVTRLDERERAADLDAPAGVSLTFAEAMPIRDVLLMLFRGTPLSIVLEDGVAGTFTGELTKLSARQALEAVLEPAGLDYEIRGPIVRVFPRRAETRIFTVDYLDVRRSWQRRSRSGTADGGASAELSSAAERDFFGGLESGVRAMLSPSGRVHVDRTTGLVQVTDFAERLEQVGVYLEMAAARATRQVRLNARVLEVTLAAGQPAVDWASVAARAGGRAGNAAGITVRDPDGLLRAIASYGDVRTIAAPELLATNNQPAVLRLGADPGAASVPADASLQSEGLTLTVVPQIASDGLVHLGVSPSYGTGDVHPSTIEADTLLRVRGGDTVVLGGLTRTSGQPPVRREIVILLTPTVVNAGASMAGGQ